MVKIEAFIHPFKLDAVKAALDQVGVRGTTYSQVLCHPQDAKPNAYYRGAQYQVDVPVLKVEALVSSFLAEEAIDALSLAARTNGSDHDGLIFVYELADAVEIRSGKRAEFILD